MATTSEYTEHQHPSPARIEALAAADGLLLLKEERRELAGIILCTQCRAIYNDAQQRSPIRQIIKTIEESKEPFKNLLKGLPKEDFPDKEKERRRLQKQNLFPWERRPPQG